MDVQFLKRNTKYYLHSFKLFLNMKYISDALYVFIMLKNNHVDFIVTRRFKIDTIFK